MDLSVGDHDMDFLWENQSWEPSNSDNSGEGKENVKPPYQSKEGNKGDQALVNNKKRGRGGNACGNDEKKNVASGEGKDGKCRESDHEMHIWTERERRKKMRNMFTNLHALLPQLSSKADKSTIVDEAVKYIKNLQQTLKTLQKQKEERVQCVSSTFGCEWKYPYDSSFITDQGSSNYNLSNVMMGTSNALSTPLEHPIVGFRTWTSTNVVLNIFGNEGQFCICAAKKPCLLSTIAFVFEKYKIEVMSANILSNGNGNAYMILAHAKRASHQFADAKTLEETYMKAARELKLLVA